MQLTNFFSKGFRKTLKLINGTQFSYAGPWIGGIAGAPVVIDTWNVGDFMSADYTISVDQDTTQKEIIKCLIVASPQKASVMAYGRTDLNGQLVTLTATVDNSKLSLIATPAGNCKMIFSATYYQTLNPNLPNQ